MKPREKLVLSAVILAIFVGLIYAVKSVLMPFLCSIVLAYFLNPLVERFYRRYHISRLRATSLILGLFFSTILSTSLLIMPIIYSQTVDFIGSIPSYLKIFTTQFYPKISSTLNSIGFSLDQNFSDVMAHQGMSEKILNFSQEIVHNAITSSSVIIDVLSLVFIMPILLFYFLKDWSAMIDRLNEYLPRECGAQIRKIMVDIDHTMSGYIRGQFNVCLMLGIIYAALLSCTGLNFGFLIGFMTGMLVFIPYIGMLIGVTAAIVVALFQWGFDFGNIGLVVLVFFVGQVIESNFLTPKLVGSRIGLHPLWLIFGLFFFGALFGFIGVLLAVPLTAISGVIIKHAAAEYKKRFV